MKTTRQLLPVAAIAALLGACSQTQSPDPMLMTNSAASPSGTNIVAQIIPCAGMVVGADGRPLAGVTVEYWGYTGGNSMANSPEREKRTATGADGAFAMRVSQQAGLLLARKKGLATAWMQLGRPSGSGSEPEKHLKLVMFSPVTLAGWVLDESNRPVAKARVFVTMAAIEKAGEDNGRTYDYINGKPAREFFAAGTDAKGRFRIEGLPADAVAMLGIESPGRALRPEPEAEPRFDSLPWHAGQENVQLTVEPAAGIEGTITVPEGQRLPMAHLTLRPQGPSYFGMAAPQPVQSGVDGVFRFKDLQAGSYLITATFGTDGVPDWAAETVAVLTESGRTTRGVRVAAQRGGLLEVIVRSERNRQPVSGTRVVVYRDNSESVAITDNEGIARLRLVPGEYQIFSEGQSMTSSRISASVEAGITNHIELEVAAPRNVAGMVRKPDGQPAAGLEVRLVGGYGPVSGAKTDANGRFILKWNPRQAAGQTDSTACILIRDPDHNLAVARDIDEDTTNLDLNLTPGLTLVGRAESGGKPVTNSTEQLVFWTGRSGMWMQGLARTIAPGHYEIPALPPGRKYGVVVSAPGYGQKQLFNLDISADAGRQEIDTVELMPANLKLAGRVLDAADEPVPGCYVSLSGDGQPNDRTRTDREGRFVFANVCAGILRIFANNQSSYGSVSAEGGDTNVVLQLGQNYSSAGGTVHPLKGIVTDPDGKPVAGAELRVFPSSGSGWARTSARGEYHLTWERQPWQSSDAQLIVRNPVRDLAAAEELSEDVTNLNVKLGPALNVIGRIKAADNRAIHGAQAGLWLKTGNNYEQFNDRMITVTAEGRFEIQCLAPQAQYLVYATATGYGRNQQWVEPGAETNLVELEPLVLSPADKIVAGQVLDAEDKPVFDVNVSLMNVLAAGEGQPEVNATTDRDGKFRLQVCEGEVRLYANSQSGNQYAQATVEAGDTNVVMSLQAPSGDLHETPRRVSLKNNPLPDLTGLNFAPDAAPADQPVLLCLFNASERPSRHVIHLLNELAPALRQRNIRVLGIQSVTVSDDIFNEWKTAAPISFPVGRVPVQPETARWAHEVEALPWLILADANHRVIAEGFSMDELEVQIQKLDANDRELK